MRRTPEEKTKYWNAVAAKHLVGRTITAATYMSDEEANGMYWANRAVVLQLDNNALVVVQADDEGNDAGVLVVQTPEGNTTTLPVLANSQYSFDLD